MAVIGTPSRTNSAATVWARRSDRRWLYWGVPDRSALPCTSMRVDCTRVLARARLGHDLPRPGRRGQPGPSQKNTR